MSGEAGGRAWRGDDAWWPPGDHLQQQQHQQQQQQHQQQQHHQQQQLADAHAAAHLPYKMDGPPGAQQPQPAAYDYRMPPQWWYSAGPAPDQLHHQQQRQEEDAQHQQSQQTQRSSQQSASQQSLQQQQQAQQTLQQQIQTAQQQLQSAQQQLQSAQQQQQLQNAQQQLQSHQQQHLQSQQLQSQQLQLQQQGLQQLAQAQALQAAQQASQQKGRMPRGRADNKPRGRITAYAYFVQTCREEHKKKHPDENVIFADFSKKCAERWKTMLDKEKQRFHEMAERDKKRYDLEMLSYVPPKGEKLGRGRKRKQIKDPNAPKRSLSAFFWFCNDERSKVKALNPEYGVGNIAKELGRRWADCDPETKAKYEAMSEKDKARYDREMTAYKKKPKADVPLPEEEDDPEEDEFE